MSAPGLRPEDVVAAAGFIAVVVGALAWSALRHASANSPHAQARRRAIEMAEANRPAAVIEAKESAIKPSSPAFDWLESAIGDVVRKIQERAGAAGLTILILAVLFGAVAGAAPIMAFNLSSWFLLLTVPAVAVLCGQFCLRTLTSRYKQKFLNYFPDALDLMIRAVQAGVPVVQAILMVGDELPAPLGSEFRRMGNALRLGMEPQAILDAAAERIDLADFRFFVVCLQLQRETGGPLAETLENLAGIIRARRDTRLKTRALTAEGRASSAVISAIPVVMIGALEVMGSDYLDILTSTPSGQHLLTIAGGLLLVGLGLINFLMRLEA